MISQQLDMENQLLIFAESDSGISMILEWGVPQELDNLEFRMNNPKLWSKIYFDDFLSEVNIQL